MGSRPSEAYERRRLELLAREATGSVLDLGHAAWPNPFLPGEDVVGLDLDEPTTPSGYRQDLIGSVLDLRSVLGGERFDTVIAGELIEHLEEPYVFLRSVREVVAESGKLLLSTPNPLGFPTLGLEIIRSRRWFYTRNHTYYFLPRWVARMLDLTGFELERTLPVGLWLPRGYIRWSPVWLSYQLIYIARPRPR